MTVRMRGIIGLAAVAGLMLVGSGAAAQEAAAPTWARITYISGTTIYLEVGSKNGLTERTTLDVVRAGAVIAQLRVTALSSSRAAAEALPPPVDLVIGDSVRFVAVAPAPSAPNAAVPRTAITSTQGRRSGVLRGRMGMRYLVIAPDGNVGGGFTQPAYDLRLDGQQLGGTGFGVNADVRAQRTQYDAGASSTARPTTNVTRVYQAAVSWAAPRTGLRLTAGRQMAGALSSVGLFDGVSVDYDRQHWGLGAFSGTQPDIATFGLSTQIREHGAYAQLHTPVGAKTTSTFSMGGVGSYVAGQIDREYAFARFTASNPMLSVYATQELDFNRGWKLAAEHSATTPTATFLSVHFTPVRAVSFSGGFDNRRSVRLYRDYQSPELAFDDAFREGTWGGLSFAAPRYVRMSVDRRDSRGGPSGAASSTTVTGSFTGYSPLRLGVRLRGTSYAGSLSSGQLVSGAVEIDPWGFLRLEANGGSRTTTSSGAFSASGAATRLTWWGVDADIGIGRSLYVLLSTYREKEVDRGSLQTYASISWRF